MDWIKKVILSILFLLVFVSLVVAFRSFLMTYLVEPVATLFWVVWRIFSSIDQHIYWVVLIVICAILVMSLIPTRKEKSPKTAYNYTNTSLPRVEYWRTALEDAARGKNEREFLRDNLKNLFISAVARKERAGSIEPESVLAEEEKGPLSPAARRYLFPSSGQSRNLSVKFFAPGWLRPRATKLNHRDYALIDEIIKRMEAELEISTDAGIGTDLETNNEQ